MSTFDSTKPAARNAYDADIPPNLLNFMLRSWHPRARKLPRVLASAASFAERRQRLSQRFTGELLIIPSGHRKVRANDTYYSFRPGTDFYYLTGAVEPDCNESEDTSACMRGDSSELGRPARADAIAAGCKAWKAADSADEMGAATELIVLSGAISIETRATWPPPTESVDRAKMSRV